MSSSEAERLARVTLSLVSEPGDFKVLSPLTEIGAATLLEGIADAERFPQYAAARARLGSVDPAAELQRAAERGIRFLIPGDEEWPTQLDDLAALGPVQLRGGVPIGLWVVGPQRLDQLQTSVSVVGARDSTTYGDQVAAEITAGLAEAGFATVSGAAIGIDYAAHRGAVAGSAPTVAVLACGVDRDYPPRHADLLRYLRTHGAVVSEVPMGGAPQRIRFLARNRVIAALSRGTVVVEAAARSGALSTLNWAQRLNRHTMGVPGPVTSITSVGVHHQIRSGAASLVTCAADVLELIGEMGSHLVEAPRGQENARDRLTEEHQQVLDAVPVYNGATSDSIARVASLEAVAVREALARLESSGLVEREGVGWRLAEEARI